MRNTKFTTSIKLGKLDGEVVRLAAPSWDCDWYWGFGYIQNNNLHTHFHSFDRENNRNLFDSIKARFTNWPLSDSDTWTFCELIKTFYQLKQQAELCNRGGMHYTTNPLKDLLKDDMQCKKINDEILPRVFDEIYNLFNK